LDGHLACVGINIGIALASPGDHQDTLMRKADIALYSAKAKGGGFGRLFAERLDAQRTLRLRSAG